MKIFGCGQPAGKTIIKEHAMIEPESSERIWAYCDMCRKMTLFFEISSSAEAVSMGRKIEYGSTHKCNECDADGIIVIVNGVPSRRSPSEC